MWMTNGRRFHVRLAQFAPILGLSSQLDIPKKLHSRRVMMPREMTPMYIQDGGFQPPKVEGLLPHFLVLHRMMRRTLTPRIGYSEAIPAYERNLLDALIKPVCFDVFEYIMDEIWNITTSPLRSCGFAPFIQFMIKSVAQEKFYKDVHHDSLRTQYLRIQGLLMLVLLLLLLLLLLTLPTVVVPPLLLLPTLAS
jgi:hypothetical protein